MEAGPKQGSNSTRVLYSKEKCAITEMIAQHCGAEQTCRLVSWRRARADGGEVQKQARARQTCSIVDLEQGRDYDGERVGARGGPEACGDPDETWALTREAKELRRQECVPVREERVYADSRLRAVAATGNYLGKDRNDVQLAAKEVSRLTSKLAKQDWRSAKKLARYLKVGRNETYPYGRPPVWLKPVA